MSEILPIVPSIQPLNSHALGDEDYQFYSNPIWEPSQNGVPFWEYTTPRQPFPSDMENTSPTTTDESGVPGDEIPTTIESTPVSSTPATGGLPPGYRALRNFLSSPFSTSIWLPPIFSNTEPLTPQHRGIVVTSVTTPPTVSVASSTPIFSRPSTSLFVGFDPTSNVPLEGHYE